MIGACVVDPYQREVQYITGRKKDITLQLPVLNFLVIHNSASNCVLECIFHIYRPSFDMTYHDLEIWV